LQLVSMALVANLPPDATTPLEKNVDIIRLLIP
jgi:hypothetical protein